MMELVVVFCNFKNTPKNVMLCQVACMRVPLV